MTGFLSKANILPGLKYNVTEFNMAIKNTLNRNPSIHCVKERETHDIYLAEIRICFNKKLELVNCDGVRFGREPSKNLGDTLITNCDLNALISYPSVLPNHLLKKLIPNETKSVWRFPWVNLYKLIQIVKWFTL